MHQIRVFVSSPADVAAERLAARDVVERLQRHFRQRAAIDAAFWEDTPFEADATYQQQIHRPSQFDLAVFLLWSTVGRSPVTVDGVQHPSGTMFEFHDAERSRRAVGRPRLLLYRKTAPPPTDIRDTPEQFDARRRQFLAVESFFQTRVDANRELLAHRTFQTEGEFAEMLEEDLRRKIEELLRDRATQQLQPRDPGQPLASPYRGLLAYDEANEHVFFGRTRALHQVMDALRRRVEAQQPFMLIFGRSGIGKSSFVRAGLAPHITRAGRLAKVSLWRRAVFEPSDSTEDLYRGLAAAIADPAALPEVAEAAGGVDGLALALRERPAAAAASVSRCLAALAPPQPGKTAPRLLLIIDPLEEVFTYRARRLAAADDHPERDAVALRAEHEGIAAALAALCASQAVLVLATLRHDFFEQCASIPALRELIEGDGHHHLLPLSPTELAQAVRLPAAAAGLRFEEVDGQRLDDRLVDDALAHTEPLPLLSYTLDQLFERSGAAFTGVLTFKAFEQLGGLEGSIAKRAEEARAAARTRIPDGRRRIAWDGLFGRLVDIDQSGRRVRIYAPVESFTDPDVEVVRHELEQARLLVVDKDDRGRAVTSIAHESMLRQWPFLRDWIEDRSEALRLRSMLQAEAVEWQRSGRAAEALVRTGERLRRAQELLADPRGLQIPADVRAFVEACVARDDEAARRSRRRRRARNAIAAIACLVLAATGVLAWERADEARAAEARSDRRLEKVFGLVDWMFEELPQHLHKDNERDRRIVAAIGNKAAAECERLPEDGDGEDVRRRLADFMAQMAGRLSQLDGQRDAARVMQLSVALLACETADERRLRARRRNELGDYWWRASQYEASELAHKQALAELTELGALESDDHLKALKGLARALKPKARFAEAVDNTQKIIRILEARGPDAASRWELAGLYNDLSDLQRNRRKFEAANDASKAALAQLAQLPADFVPPPGRTLASLQMEVGSDEAVLLHRWGQADADRDRIAQALTQLEQWRARFTPPDSDRAALLYKLARVQIDLGQLDAAQTCLEESHALLLKQGQSARMAKCKEARACLRLEQRRLAEAKEDIEAVIEIRERLLPRHHPDLLDARRVLAQCLEQLGRTADAQTLRQDVDEQRARFERQERDDERRIGAAD